MNRTAVPPAAAFFLPGARGARFCLYHAPAGSPRGALLYIHPFAEEMNCARRTAALQSRRLAQAGYGVLQIDLSGCGDSWGEFGDATWQMWRQDVLDGAAWLAERCGARVGLWGLRLGALLALDCCARLPDGAEQLLLWQPVLRGRPYLTQFLRMALASQMMSGGAPQYRDTEAMRAALAGGAALEVGGYELNPALVAAIDSADCALLPAPACPVRWLEVSADGVPGAQAQQQAALWREHGTVLGMDAVAGAPFWASPGHEPAWNLMGATEAQLLVAA